jgi:hypothetical protein
MIVATASALIVFCMILVVQLIHDDGFISIAIACLSDDSDVEFANPEMMGCSSTSAFGRIEHLNLFRSRVGSGESLQNGFNVFALRCSGSSRELTIGPP